MEKLVRDKIPEIIAQKGEVAEVYVADDKAYAQKLLQKLREEADEVVAAVSRDEMVSELADVREVLEAIMNFFELSEKEVSEVQKKKKFERGGFEKRYILKMENKS